MPTDKEPVSYLPWVIVAVLAWMLWNKQDVQPVPPGPVDPVVPVNVVSGVLPKIREGYKAVFSDAASKVTSKVLTNEEQLFNFLKEGTKRVREESSVEFDRLLDESIPTEFGGREAAVATFLDAVAKGW